MGYKYRVVEIGEYVLIIQREKNICFKMKKKEVLNSRIVISGFSGVLFVCPGVFGVLLYLLGFRDLTLQSMDGIVVLYDRVLLEIPLCTLENW